MSVKITDKDIVLLGHGSYPGGATNIMLPENVDLYILQPIGYTLMTDVAAALIKQDLIEELILKHENGSGNSTCVAPFVKYVGGKNAPDFTLYDLGSLSKWGSNVIGNRTNVVTVNAPSLLSELLLSNSKIKAALKELNGNDKLRLYWSACANQVSGNSASLQF